MKRLLELLAALSIIALLGACAGEVIVLVEREVPPRAEGEPPSTQTIRDLPLRAVPFDRDIVFDSLTQVAATPEPEIPEELIELQAAAAEAQREWQQAESQWLQRRDEMRAVGAALEAMDRAEAQYMARFRQWQELEIQAEALEKQKDEAFTRFTSLQQELFSQAEEARMRQENWEHDAFREVDRIFAERLKELRREVSADTTNADGIARFKLKPGTWWITGRYELPYHELYWNVPVVVERRGRVQLRLNDDNAKHRTVF